jgi:hypothetical protein
VRGPSPSPLGNRCRQICGFVHVIRSSRWENGGNRRLREIEIEENVRTLRERERIVVAKGYRKNDVHITWPTYS